MEVEVEIDNFKEFMRLRPIKPDYLSMMDERRELQDRLLKLYDKEKYKPDIQMKIFKLQDKIKELENKILNS